MKIQLKNLVLVAVILIGFTACSKTKTVAPVDTKEEGTKAEVPPPVENRKLIWADEFEGTSIDQTKWTIKNNPQRRTGIDGNYTGWHPDNVYQQDGNLVIRTSFIGDRYWGAAVETKGKFEIDSGYFEARVKLQKQPGHWGAFWLFTPSVQTVGNDGRDGTEIDIFESAYIGAGQDTLNVALHYDGYGTYHQKSNTRVTKKGFTDGNWHIFGMEWKKNQPYRFYYDGQLVWETDFGGISQVKQHIILSDEVGAWDGKQDIRKAILPDYMLVDYVRVYDYRTTIKP